MQINCEYCGAVFDTEETEGCCPKCGASFANNKKLQAKRAFEEELKRQKMEQRRIELEQKKLSLEKERSKEQFERTERKAGIIVRLIVTIPVLIVVLAMIFGGVYVFLQEKDNIKSGTSQETTNINDGKIFVDGESAQYIRFGDIAHFEKVDISIDKCEVYNYPWKKPADGFMYVRVFITNTNTSDETIFEMYEEVYCTYKLNGVTCEAESPTISSDDLDTKLRSGEIKSGLSRQGWVYFTIPVEGEFVVHFDNMLEIRMSASDILKDALRPQE
jgi:predicted  nucleic acid-binding Zn-ribbon protein